MESPQKKQDLETAQKIALVTGGTGGIGTAICKRLCHSGYKAITTYRNQEKAEKWQQNMYQQGFDVAIFACDVADFDSCQTLANDIKEQYGPVSVLVNNAGITRDSIFRKMTKDQWKEVISCNLDSVFNVTRPIIDSMIEQGYGRVINISSINGQKGQFGQANYSAAKAGMHGFTKALAQEVARKGVTVNTVSPGYIETEMVMSVPANVRDSIMAQIPVGRFGKPEEVAHVIAFLISDQAGFITGANITANGGHYME
jgi:acetoacetyl-CoA reductase